MRLLLSLGPWAYLGELAFPVIARMLDGGDTLRTGTLPTGVIRFLL